MSTCTNPELNEYLCSTCDHPCEDDAATWFDFTPSTRPYPVMYMSLLPHLTQATARYDLRASGLVA